MAAFTLVAEELEEAIASGTSQQRIDTLRRVTDLFVSGAEQFSAEHVELFDEVIGRLANQIEARARAELSDRLAEIGNAPIKVLTDLASDDAIEVAKPILTYSTRLDDQTLIGIAKTKSQHHLLAISQRDDISEPITDVLVTRGNQQVLRTVAQNAGAKLSNNGFGLLVEKSKSDEMLATHVGLRKDIPEQHMTRLIERASETVRRKLAAASPVAASEIERVLAEIKTRMKAESAPPARDYGRAKAMVAHMRKAGQFGEQQVRMFAQAAKFEETVVSLALLCGISVETVEQIMLQQKSDVPLVLARAAGLSWLTTKVIVMLQSGGSGVSDQDLAVAKDNFEKLQPATAQRVIRFHQVRQNAGKG
jgi:uncharacterized protein (DUF2336 family)